MKNRLVLCLAAAAALAQLPARAQSPTPAPAIYVPSGSASVDKQAANKQLVLDWLHDFWQGGDFAAWPKYMKADFRNHDPREPKVGAQALVDWLRDRMKGKKMKFPQPDHAHMFLIADGDLVFVGGDPKTDKGGYSVDDQFSNIAGNIIRIEDGKIAEWWYVGSAATVTAPPKR